MSGPQLNNCDREVERFYGSRDWKAGARPQLQGAEDFTPILQYARLWRGRNNYVWSRAFADWLI